MAADVRLSRLVVDVEADLHGRMIALTGPETCKNEMSHPLKSRPFLAIGIDVDVEVERGARTTILAVRTHQVRARARSFPPFPRTDRFD